MERPGTSQDISTRVVAAVGAVSSQIRAGDGAIISYADISGREKKSRCEAQNRHLEEKMELLLHQHAVEEPVVLLSVHLTLLPRHDG